jgi:hypothetical protein
MPDDRGFFAWSITTDFLEVHAQNRSAMNVTLFMAIIDDTDSNSTNDSPVQTRVNGPSVVIVYPSAAPAPSTGGGGGGPNAVSIAVPIIVVLVVLGLAAVGFWLWRKHRAARGGYGVRRSQSERVSWGSTGARGGLSKEQEANGVGIQLTDRDSWGTTSVVSPGQARMGDGREAVGKNVFREELRRQERQG